MISHLLVPSSRLAVFLGAAFLVSCTDPEAPRICSSPLSPAVVVEVRDASSGQPSATGAELTGRHTVDGTAFTDTAGPSVDGLILTLGALPGTYDLTLKKAGFVTWSNAGVIVPAADANACQPLTVRLTANIAPSP